jgi:hypothetical protein
MTRALFAVLVGCVAALTFTLVLPASAKISSMSGAYDGRGKPSEKVTVAPKKPKKTPSKDTTPQGGN